MIQPQAVFDSLKRELSGYGYDVHRAGTVEEANNLLRDPKIANTDMRWLIVGEHIPWSSDSIELVEVSASDNKPSIQFARKWLEAVRDRRAIVVVDQTQWDDLRWLTRRLLAVHSQCPDLVMMLVEMISAGDAGSVFLPPTVVKVGFAHKKDENGDLCRLNFEGCEGPLGGFLNYYDYCRRKQMLPEPERCGNFDKFNKAFEEISKQQETPARQTAIIAAAKELGKAFMPLDGMLQWVRERTRESIERLFEKDRETLNDDRPCPVHLQINARSEMMTVPLDFAVVSGNVHLGSLLPVTWRLSHDAERFLRDGDENNVTTYKDFRAVYSCDFAIGKQEAERHVREILELVGLDGSQARHVCELGDFCNAIAADLGGSAAYVLSKATHNGTNPGIAVGPIAGSDDTIDTVIALHLAPEHPSKAWAFIYFDCCHLAKQTPADQIPSSYFGSFAEALLFEGVCREMISHRWFMTTTHAFDISRDFHCHRPRTARGRAHALFKARAWAHRRTRKFEDDETSWLVPIHILESPR